MPAKRIGGSRGRPKRISSDNTVDELNELFKGLSKYRLKQSINLSEADSEVKIKFPEGLTLDNYDLIVENNELTIKRKKTLSQLIEDELGVELETNKQEEIINMGDLLSVRNDPTLIKLGSPIKGAPVFKRRAKTIIKPTGL